VDFVVCWKFGHKSRVVFTIQMTTSLNILFQGPYWQADCWFFVVIDGVPCVWNLIIFIAAVLFVAAVLGAIIWLCVQCRRPKPVRDFVVVHPDRTVQRVHVIGDGVPRVVNTLAPAGGPLSSSRSYDGAIAVAQILAAESTSNQDITSTGSTRTHTVLRADRRTSRGPTKRVPSIESIKRPQPAVTVLNHVQEEMRNPLYPNAGAPPVEYQAVGHTNDVFSDDPLTTSSVNPAQQQHAALASAPVVFYGPGGKPMRGVQLPGFIRSNSARLVNVQ